MTPPRIIIRQTEDLDTIAELDKICFPTDERETFEDQLCWLASVAVEGERLPVAFAAMRLDGHPTPSITRMGVIPEYRGGRLQRRLGTACVREAESRGFEAVYTYVSVYNTASLRSLINVGFMPYSCEDGWMQLGRWTKHRPVDKRHAKFWG